MKILVVCTSSRVFGAETMSLNLIKGLKQRGFDLLAVTTIWTDGEFSRRLEKLGISEVVLPLGTFAKPSSWKGLAWSADMAWRLPQLWWGFARTCRQFHPDIVVFTNPKHAMMLYPWLRCQPTVLLEHSQCLTNRANRWLFQTLARKLARFVSTSEYMVNHLRELGVADRQICVIKIGSFLRGQRAEFQRRAESSRAAAGVFRIGIAGQISAHKGHDSLLEATRRLKVSGKKFVVQVFGDGEAGYVGELKRRVVAASLEAEWQWLGYEPDLSQVYGSMDLCVVPSCFDEPFGMVAVEAAAQGLPVVASRRGGLKEIVADGVTGWLVESGDPAALAEKIAWCIENSERVRIMGMAAQARAFDLFSIEQTAEAFAKLFQELSAAAANK